MQVYCTDTAVVVNSPSPLFPANPHTHLKCPPNPPSPWQQNTLFLLLFKILQEIQLKYKHLHVKTCDTSDYASPEPSTLYLVHPLIGELRVDDLNGSSGVLSDNKARCHWPTALNALLEVYASGEPNCLIIDIFCSIQFNHLTH